MVSATLVRGLAALALSVGAQAQATCVQTVTARAGDTCASLAELAGISVTQFLRSNPYVTSCSALIGGAVYCKEGTATGPPTVPAASSTRSSIPVETSPSGELRVSSDGSCGGSVTCAGSRFGLCCSAHGFCGTSPDYCGEGCQVGLGECGAAVVVPSSPAVSGPVQQPTGNPGTATSTITITATIFVTSTVAETTGTTTSTAVVTTTTLAYGSTTSTIVQSVTATATTTQTIRATVVVTSTVFQTSTIQGPEPTPVRPSPVLPGTARNCKSFDKILESDTCRTLATRNDILLRDFYRLNPSVSSSILNSLLCTPDLVSQLLSGLCKINCDNLWTGYYVCTST
ncbi:hypothetical protein B0T16DRAFT_430253 [Cercophora newfieldiana]|uniref:Carbohydrate-binding module family 18 protein n=1 Tax=Cercophora newfieldiana TaxID=92897 RepID=A0AA40CMF5_9PEZI|nr:hypothetical protein B0T16DRAFT_430253 [Cercophora newfieldiana]